MILDIEGASKLDDVSLVEQALRRAADDAGATLLRVMLHRFDDGGVTGVAMLAESHISIHTWPDLGYASIDVFMCGICDPRACLPALVDTFEPQMVIIVEIERSPRAQGEPT